MKFYDKGFIYTFDDHIQVQVFTAGAIVLDLKIYENSICKDTFKCTNPKAFNKEFLHESYEENFLKKLFLKNEKNTTFRDRKNGILIKIKRD